QEQDESGRDDMILSPHRDTLVRRRTQLSRSKILGVVLLCLVIVASSMYAAFSLWRTSKPDSLVRSTQVVNQAHIPVQNDISPTQSAIPTALARADSAGSQLVSGIWSGFITPIAGEGPPFLMIITIPSFSGNSFTGTIDSSKKKGNIHGSITGNAVN